MPDYFDSAQQANDARKAAMLDAIRTQGSQAKATYDAGQAVIAQQKTQAVQAALAEATRRGAPQVELDQISQTVGTPYDRRTADLSSAAASRQSSFDQIGAGGGRYFDEANAALPVLRTQQAEHKASLDKQLAYQLATLKQQAEDRALAHQETMARLSAAAKPPGVAKLLTDTFGGPSGFVDVANSQNEQLVPGYLNDFAGRRGANGPGSAPMTADEAGQMYAESLGQNNGLPAGLGGGLLKTAQQKAAATAASQGGSSAALRQDKNYADAVADFLDGASKVGSKQGGKTLTTADVFAGLSSHYGAELARQVIADYSRAIPGASATAGF